MSSNTLETGISHIYSNAVVLRNGGNSDYVRIVDDEIDVCKGNTFTSIKYNKITVNGTKNKSYIGGDSIYCQNLTDSNQTAMLESSGLTVKNGANEGHLSRLNGGMLFIGNNDYISGTKITEEDIQTYKFVKKGATSSQFLMGDGSVTEFNKANGVPKLDANGKLDSTQITALSNSDIDAIVI